MLLIVSSGVSGIPFAAELTVYKILPLPSRAMRGILFVWRMVVMTPPICTGHYCSGGGKYIYHVPAARFVCVCVCMCFRVTTRRQEARQARDVGASQRKNRWMTTRWGVDK